MSTDALIAAIVAFLGGTGFNALLRFLSKNKETNITTEAMLRQEMTDRLDTMSSEIEEMKKEVAFWRDKYLELYKAHADLRAQLGMINAFEESAYYEPDSDSE
jgi:sensor domain CHASE-containing protein